MTAAFRIFQAPVFVGRRKFMTFSGMPRSKARRTNITMPVRLLRTCFERVVHGGRSSEDISELSPYRRTTTTSCTTKRLPQTPADRLGLPALDRDGVQLCALLHEQSGQMTRFRQSSFRVNSSKLGAFPAVIFEERAQISLHPFPVILG
ncbi:hypothetical protein M404DRAFT_297891 [Pisolithus tinctorius Marx 270]|uniref:Uncharacterized protein n=1 Tax=Pisolithus tinctorius Marx 270 TaxID=870435 RepID=A0A0C3NJ84_PISTI|nr:hypothetical protein M404DRAFT_297891 [Pisolithus tinctorius Marx 270]